MQHQDHIQLIRKGVEGAGEVWADFGSGSGAFTLALCDIIGDKAHLFSIDKDKSALRQQEEQFDERFPAAKITFINQDFTQQLDLPPLDGLILSNSLHFVPTDEQTEFLRQLTTYLKPEGRIIIVEYDGHHRSEWVPYPVSRKRLQQISRPARFSPVQLATIPSIFMDRIYSAMLRPVETPRLPVSDKSATLRQSNFPTNHRTEELMNQPIIDIDNVSKIYHSAGEEVAALKNISMSIQPGESLAIIGKSGSGKSTLMHLLATLDRPTTGTMKLKGKDVTKIKQTELERLRNKTFGFVFQQFFVNPRNTCLENVELPLSIMGLSPSERKKRSLEMLEQVGLADKARQKANDLSGGQKQRLCIARALVTHPEVIFADEPTGNLDSENGKIVTDLLFKMQKEQGITLVMVTHDADLANLCQRQITIKDGEIIKESK
jgi:putative ABC transport system ATP-binding protein